MYAGTICDARFSKCCGGAFEEFQNCWENVKHPYLIGQRDCKIEDQLPDLTIETEADKWIRTSPVAFCHTQDKKDPKPGFKQLWPGNDRLLSLESLLLPTRTFNPDSSTFGDWFRANSGLNSYRTGNVGTPCPIEDCRNLADTYYRKRAGNTSYPIYLPIFIVPAFVIDKEYKEKGT